MSGFWAIFEVMREALIWAMGWVLERQPQTEEALRLFLLIFFTGIATALSFYWRDLAYRSPSIRRKLLPDERYAGRYLQAVWRSDEVRYAVIHIYFNSRKRRFEALGRNYNSSGEETSSFKANYMLFPSDKDDNIEFIWQGSHSSAGYTRMRVETSDEDYIEGDGFVMTFGQKPKTYPLLFKHLHNRHVRQALGVDAPLHSAEEPRFIRKFHAKLGGAVRESFENAPVEVA
jgi:hypothetical protein